MRKALVALAVASLSALVTPDAGAIGFTTAGADGGIEVDPGLGACGWLEFPGQTFVGEFTALAYVQGPGTKAGVVRGVIPVVGYGYWSGCIPGAYYGATLGEGKYTLNAAAATNQVHQIKECVVLAGALTCQ